MGISARRDGGNRGHRDNPLRCGARSQNVRPCRRSRASSCTWGSVARDCAFGRGAARGAKEAAGIEPGRADVIFAGAAILERIMGHFGLTEVIVSDQGIRWGLIWRELGANPS